LWCRRLGFLDPFACSTPLPAKLKLGYGEDVRAFIVGHQPDDAKEDGERE
jgi:hypothetical protein